MCFQREFDTFGTEESFFTKQLMLLQAKRLRLTECLRSIGLHPFVPDGGYFIVTDVSTLSEYSHKYSIIKHARQFRELVQMLTVHEGKL